MEQVMDIIVKQLIYMNMNYKKDFENFLSENNALSIFNKNMKLKKKDSDLFLEKYKKLHDMYLSCCFIWSDTKEGKEYWKDLEIKWRKRYE